MFIKRLFGVLLWAFLSLPLCSQSTVDQLVGINAEAKDPLERVRRFTFVRDYHDWAKDTGFGNNSGTITCPPNLSLKWNPSADGADYYSFDAFYEEISGRNSAALKGTMPDLVGLNQYPGLCARNLELKPLCTDNQLPPEFGFDYTLNQCTIDGVDYLAAISDATDPALYIGHAQWMTLFASRYGHTVYDVNSEYVQNFIASNLAPNEDLTTGLGYATLVENNNEPDKTWYDNMDDVIAQDINPQQAITYWYFAAEQYAAMVSADYDGHGRSAAFRIPGLQEDHYFGVKNADPNMAFVLAGLAEMRGAYIERMIEWFKDNRVSGKYGFVEGPVIPFDVINIHHYSTDIGATINTKQLFKNLIYDKTTSTVIGTNGVSPEADKLKEKLGWFIDFLYADHASELAGTSIWLTEFGYDSENTDASGVDVPQIDACNYGQEVQAQWLMRSILEISAARGKDNAAAGIGIDKATIFNLTNDFTLGINSYRSSGLINDNFDPKKAWYYTMTLKNAIGSYEFVADEPDVTLDGPNIPVGDDAPRVYKYSNGSDNTIYAIWSPTSTGASYDMDITFNLDAENSIFAEAHYIKVKDLDENGVKVDVTANIVGGRSILNLPVNETPIFLKLRQAANNQNTGVTTLDQISAEPVCCNGVKLCYRPFNSQYNSPATRFRIYYIKKADLADPLEFDIGLTRLQTNSQGFPELVPLVFMHEESTSLRCTVIPNLDPEPYYFYVFPIDGLGNITANINPAACGPTDLGGLFVEDTPGICTASNCLIDIPSAWVTTSYDNLPNNQGVPLRTNVLATLNADGDNLCSAIAEEIPINTNAYWFSGNSNSFIINFPEPHNLDAIYYNDGGGIAPFRIQYQVCNCPEWAEFTVFNTLDGGIPRNAMDPNTDYIGEWEALNIDKRWITKLRFTKLAVDANVQKLLFCGAPSACFGNYSGLAGPTDSPSEVTAKNITTNSALIEWQPAVEEIAEGEYSYAVDYEVYYDRSVDFDNEVYENNPSIAIRATGQMGVDLLGLTPATDYTVVVKRAKPKPCVIVTDTYQFFSNIKGFRTKDALSESRESVLENLNAKARPYQIIPNPTRDQVLLVLPQKGYTLVEFFSVDGKLVYGQEIAGASERAELRNLSGLLNPGMYYVKVSGKNLVSQIDKLLLLE